MMVYSPFKPTTGRGIVADALELYALVGVLLTVPVAPKPTSKVVI